MKVCYLFILALLPLFGISQTTLYFSYDASGNQILRDVVCINCGKSSNQQTNTDSTFVQVSDPAKDSSALHNENSNQVLTASPNPVSHMLKVQWIYDEKKPLSKLYLHTADGKVLVSRNINLSSGQTDIDFSGYAAGIYFLIGVDINGHKYVIRVLKN